MTLRSRRASVPSLALGALVALSGALAAGSCGTGSTDGAAATSASATPPVAEKPTLRLYLLSTVAGAVVPCGCSKDQLGGADHFAAYVAAQRDKAGAQLLLGAGPLLFQEPLLEGDLKQQNEWKAEALADAMKSLGLAAWAPGANDFSGGAEMFAALAARSGAQFVGANLEAKGVAPSSIVEVAGVKVGIVGLSDPTEGQPDALEKALAAEGGAPGVLGMLAKAGVRVKPPLPALEKEVAALREKGARLVIGLVAMPRGEALRLFDQYTGLDVVVLGKAKEKGDGNDAPKPAVLVGSTVVVEASNHLQSAAVLDVFLREPAGSAGRIALADGGGIAKAEELVSLAMRIRDLETRIQSWEMDRKIAPADLAARKADLEKLRRERESLEADVPAPASGSYFRYNLVEVRESLGEDATVAANVLGFRKRVNEHNKVAFADRKPEPAPEGTARFVGVEACSTCHREERAVWDKTAHAKAYPTLVAQHVEYNLECVGCHVTGYDLPGGSTVTHVKGLENVGCEVCHGPGSRHADKPEEKGLVIARPDPKTCVSACHHPPHVENFDAAKKIELVLGPGHGK